MDGIARDPARVFGCQEGDNTTDVVGLRQALECLHAQCEVPARLRLGEIRHVRLDYTGRDGIDAYAAYAKQRGEMLHQGVDGALSCCIRRGRTDNGMRSERREENDAASFGHDRKELLHKEERRPNVDREELV